MSGILTKIRFEHVKGATLCYFFEKNFLDEIGLVPTEYDPNETFFNKGDIITYDEEKFKVVEIRTKFFNKIHEPHGYGINMYGVGETLPYNFLITYIVEDAE